MTIAAGPIQTPGRRRRSEGKRAAVLDAAETLFISCGYDGASVDAIAARASVSKRTIYDHFDDKPAIFALVLQRVHAAVVDSVETAIDEELTPGRDLGKALNGFARRVVTRTVTSSDYANFRSLTSQRPPAPQLPPAVHGAPERLLEVRFAAMVKDGDLQAGDTRLAVMHFVALTIGIALDALHTSAPQPVGADEVGVIISSGVEAFLRAYG